MYPRNAASPERVDIGAVVQISDGAVQTSGCTVRIIPAGGAEGDGAGTTAYSTDGVVLYTPTQAETNYTSFILIAKKAGCIPASKTVVTSANATAGKVTVGTNEDKTGYTASTVSDKTGYSLAAGHGLATEAKQDSILGYVDCLPATWVVPAAAGAAMTLTSGERTTLAAAIEAAIINELDGTAVMQAIADLIANDMTTTDLTVAAIASACRDAILNRVLSGNHDTAGTPGKLLQNCDIAVSGVNTVAGNVLSIVSHVAYGNQAIATMVDGLPTVAEFEARTVPAASIATSTQTAAILDAVGVVDTVVDAIKVKTDGLNFAGTDVKATLDGEEVTPTAASKTGYKLASDGLDSITATEPSAKPSTFPGWLMWLVQRFRCSEMTASALTVKTEAGATVTTQALSDNGTTQSVGAPS